MTIRYSSWIYYVSTVILKFPRKIIGIIRYKWGKIKNIYVKIIEYQKKMITLSELIID